MACQEFIKSYRVTVTLVCRRRVKNCSNDFDQILSVFSTYESQQFDTYRLWPIKAVYDDRIAEMNLLNILTHCKMFGAKSLGKTRYP